MVRYGTIIKVIDDELSKCKATANAKYLGSNGIWSSSTDQWGHSVDILTYPDGTRITFDRFGDIMEVGDEDGFSAKYETVNGTVPQFDSFPNDIRERYGEEGYRLFMDYTNFKMSTIGMYFNSYLRGEMSKDEFYSKVESWVGGFGQGDFGQRWTRGMTGTQIADYLIENDGKYQEMCNGSLNGYGDFATIRQVGKLHSNDNLGKRIVKDSGYTSSSVGMSRTEIDETLDINGGWTIITKCKDGNPANRGLYLGYPEYKNMGFNCWFEVLNAPGQKFMRTHIDEENRIIIQEPYEP